MALPRLLVTGASGFIGRRTLQLFRDRFQILALARRSQDEVQIEHHPNVRWIQLDVGDREPLAGVLREVAADGVDVVLHLAAHYDFAGTENAAEYWRTNVDGLRNVLDICRDLLAPDLFLFASSVAACGFPDEGHALDEDSPPNGDHIYAETKRIGERMLAEYDAYFKSCIVRFGALFSDWCEYPPLYVFLDTWLSRRWNRHVLGGQGESAVPYLHVDDAVMCLNAVVNLTPGITPREIFLASSDGATSHVELFRAATAYWHGYERRPFFMPRLLCGPGMWILDLVGRLVGQRPFERPWMARYIDLKMVVNAARTRRRLDWAPRDRLEILRRLPFALENMRSDPIRWRRKNAEAMALGLLRPNIRLYYLLKDAKEEIAAELTRRLTAGDVEDRFGAYRALSTRDHQWHHHLILQYLMTSIRTRDRGIFMTYCRDLAERRFHQSFPRQQVVAAVDAFHTSCLNALREHHVDLEPGMRQAIKDYITASIRFGSDRVEDTYDRLELAERQLPYRGVEDNAS
jgi:nucleoside-diphosphate-sugar epimerase